MSDLYPHQVVAIDGIRSSLRSGKRRPVLALPTGSGKTRIATEIILGARAKGNRVTFTVPFLSLVKQTFDAFVARGLDTADIGVIQGDHAWKRAHAPIQIASVQTLARRGFPCTDFVIVDEVHLNFAVIHKWLKEDDRRIFIGLSASPWSKGMGEVWDDLVIPTTMAKLIDGGFLSEFRVFASSKPDLTGVKTVAGEYHEGQLSEVMSGKQIVADVVTTWLEKAERRKTLLFAVDRAHAANLHTQFNEAGVGCAYVDGETPREEREAIFARYRAGEFQVISSVGTLTTGVDVPCQCIVMARPTKSEILWVQMVGRGLRTEPGKLDCLVLDHAGNCLSLGLPTEIGRTTLRTGATDEREKAAAKEKPEPLPRECRQCGCLMPARVRVCEACGFEAKRLSTVETIEGELTELGTGPAKKSEPAIERLRKMGKQSVYWQLNDCKGTKSDGWVTHKFRAIFGVWPRSLDDGVASASPELRSWLHSERIKWAKGQANARMSRQSDSRELAHA